MPKSSTAQWDCTHGLSKLWEMVRSGGDSLTAIGNALDSTHAVMNIQQRSVSQQLAACVFESTAAFAALDLNNGTLAGIGYSTVSVALDTVLAQYGKTATPNGNTGFVSPYNNPWGLAAIDLANDFLRYFATHDIA